MLVASRVDALGILLPLMSGEGRSVVVQGQGGKVRRGGVRDRMLAEVEVNHIYREVAPGGLCVVVNVLGPPRGGVDADDVQVGLLSQGHDQGRVYYP